jgi:DivIVA domain-containing protein
VDIDRQAIERRDFPIARRGYDTAAVDAHLRALAGEFDELQSARAKAAGEPSLASTAASQVQSILAAAETAAADIERQATQDAGDAREEAARDAERTREDALRQARAHVAAVAQATAVLLERVGSMDGEVGALLESLRAGAGRLAGDLAAVETNMGELYDAASGRADGPGGEPRSTSRPAPTPATPPAVAAAPELPASAPSAPATFVPPASAPPIPAPPAPTPLRSVPQPAQVAARAAQADSGTTQGDVGDLDGARLIALNMALNGESRADADRYLAENFRLADREKLIDEVYAAIEG